MSRVARRVRERCASHHGIVLLDKNAWLSTPRMSKSCPLAFVVDGRGRVRRGSSTSWSGTPRISTGLSTVIGSLGATPTERQQGPIQTWLSSATAAGNLRGFQTKNRGGNSARGPFHLLPSLADFFGLFLPVADHSLQRALVMTVGCPAHNRQAALTVLAASVRSSAVRQSGALQVFAVAGPQPVRRYDNSCAGGCTIISASPDR